MRTPSRRRVLRTVCTGAIPLVAGCIDDANEGGGTAEPTSGDRTDAATSTSETTPEETTGDPDEDDTVEPALWSFREADPETDTEMHDCWNCTGIKFPLVVADGTVYVPGQDLHALNGRDGTRRWRVETGPPIDGTPVVSDGDVYARAGFSFRTGSRNERLVAVGPDGRRRWTYEDDWRDGTFLPVLAVGPDRVYVCPRQDYSVEENPVRAIDWERGAVEWTARMPTAMAGNGAVLGDAVVIGSHSRTTAVDAASGDTLWTLDEGGARPTVVGERAVFSVNDGIAALTRNGEAAWRFADASQYVIEGETLYAYGYGTPVHAVDPGTGEERWRYDPAADIRFEAADGDAVYVEDQTDSSLVAVADGEVRWRRGLDGSPTVDADGGAIYAFETADGATTVRSLSPADGSVRWRTTLDERVTGQTVRDGAAYHVTDAGRVHAFPAERPAE